MREARFPGAWPATVIVAEKVDEEMEKNLPSPDNIVSNRYSLRRKVRSARLKTIGQAIRWVLVLCVGLFLFRWINSVMAGAEGFRIDLAFEIVIALLLYGVFLAGVLGPPYIRKAANYFTGLYWPDDSHFPVLPEYSVAEAIEEYHKVVAQFPDDIYAHVRAAELFVERFNDPRSAEIELLAAVEKAKVEDAFAFGAQRLADLYQYSLQEPRRAFETLAMIPQRYPNSKRAKAASQRMKALERAVAVRSQLPPPARRRGSHG